RFSTPVKTFLNCTMPALVNISVGSLRGTSGLDATASWPLRAKKSTKLERRSFTLVINGLSLGKRARRTPWRDRLAFYRVACRNVQHCRALARSREPQPTEKRHRASGALEYPCMGGGLLGVVTIVFATGDQQHLTQETRAFAHALFDRVGDVRVVLEELAGILTSLPQPLRIPGEPGAGLY